jgi:hypothetical protein
VAIINYCPPFKGPFMQDDNITDIHTYLRLCGRPHNLK